MITEQQIAEWRARQGQGMTSGVGEYTPSEFWDALDEIVQLRAEIVQLRAEIVQYQAVASEANVAVPSLPSDPLGRDPMAGLRGMRADDSDALVKQAMREAGVTDEEQKDVKPLGWNICMRVAQAAHKTGAQQMKRIMEAVASEANVSVPSLPSDSHGRDPIDMVLHCPACGLQHIDLVGNLNEETLRGCWANPPHRSHLCHGCHHIWRPADVPTNGVKAVKTEGKNDSPIAVPAHDPGAQS